MIGTGLAIALAATSAAGSIASSKIASNSAKNAAKTQADAATQASTDTKAATDQALQYIERSRGMVPTGNASPSYMDLSRRMGILRPSTPGPSPGTASGVSPAMNPYGRLATPGAPAPDAGMVMLEAPNGQRRAVSAAEAEHFIAQGARRV
jgi:hypothetical protein